MKVTQPPLSKMFNALFVLGTIVIYQDSGWLYKRIIHIYRRCLTSQRLIWAEVKNVLCPGQVTYGQDLPCPDSRCGCDQPGQVGLTDGPWSQYSHPMPGQLMLMCHACPRGLMTRRRVWCCHVTWHPPCLRHAESHSRGHSIADTANIPH